MTMDIITDTIIHVNKNTYLQKLHQYQPIWNIVTNYICQTQTQTNNNTAATTTTINDEYVNYRCTNILFTNKQIQIYDQYVTNKHIDYATIHGNLTFIKHVEKNKNVCTQVKFDKNHYNKATNYGHLHIIKWLHENRKEGCTAFAMNDAAENGYLHIVQWLHENRNEGCTEWAMNDAAKNGHLNIVHYLHENRTEGCTEWAVHYACQNDHLHILQILYENGYQHHFSCFKNQDGTPSQTFIQASDKIKQWIKQVVWKSQTKLNHCK
jgi:hypothetical protein